MPDHATSSSPAVQRQLDRLTALGTGRDTLGLERITVLLDRLDRPQDRLPPVFHIAGTNGKGSTAAVLRAAIEADGRAAHVYTSPHLVRFNERIRLAGRLVEDEALADALERALAKVDKVYNFTPSFFEATTAAAFLLFAEHPADALVLEVGLGGRLDATNVIADPAACGIAALGLDHQGFLGDDLAGIAREKAGIARAGRPLVTLAYPKPVASAVTRIASTASAPVVAEGRDWAVEPAGNGLAYRDGKGALRLDGPSLVGAHQAKNAGLAIAMLRHQDRLVLSDEALTRAPALAHWPARLQRLPPGPLVERLTSGRLGGGEVWLDGGHNPDAACALAAWLFDRPPVTLIVGLLANKDAPGFLSPLAPHVESIVSLPIAGHDSHPPDELARIARSLDNVARAAPDLDTAIKWAGASRTGPVLIAGSLYLAGEVLRANGNPPD